MGLPLRSFAADAKVCIVVQIPQGQPDTSLWCDDTLTKASSPLINVLDFTTNPEMKGKR
jgi:hypothetical protein